MALKIFLLMREDVIAPETREVLLEEGAAYDQAYVLERASACGFDYLDARVILAESLGAAQRIACRL